MKKVIVISVICITLIVALFSFSVTSEDYSSSLAITDAISEYLNKPNAIYRSEVDKTFFCWMDTDSGAYARIAHYDHSTETFSSVTSVINVYDDDHCAPTMVINDTGYIIMFCSVGHPGDLYSITSSNPYDETSWNSAVSVATYTNYPKPWIRSDGRIYVAYRTGGAGSPTSYKYSDNDGSSWSSATQICSDGYCQVYGEPGTNYVHFCFTQGTTSRTNVYYARSDDGGATWKKISTGSTISLPFTTSNTDILWTATRLRQYDLCADLSTHYPYVLGTKDIDTDTSSYVYQTYWDGDSFEEYNLTCKTDVFLTQSSPDYRSYSTGGFIDRDNVSRVFVSEDYGGSNNISVWYRSGSSWSRHEWISDTGNTYEIRPMPVETGHTDIVGWWSGGDYTDYHTGDWDTDMYAIYSESGGDPPASDISFYSINGGVNGSTTIYQDREFIWTKVANATAYQLQVDNSSSFSDPFIDLSNISSGSSLFSMPGGSYSENSTHVTVALPYAYNITWYGAHYYRVRAYST